MSITFTFNSCSLSLFNRKCNAHSNTNTNTNTIQHLSFNTFPLSNSNSSSSSTLIAHNFSKSKSPVYPSEPHPESLKSRLHNGDTLYGLFLCSFSPSLAEIAGLSGYDFVVVDMEHGFGSFSDALPCLRALAATDTPAILRLPETTAALAKKALDLGPQGIMFPMIETPEQARQAVSYCRYPPRGVRGAAHPIVRASGYGIDAGYLNNCEDELLIMCQVESQVAADKVGEIAEVEGVDCIQMGPTDLSASMGHLWDPGNRKVIEMMNNIEKTVLDTKTRGGGGGGGASAYLCGFAMPHDTPQQLKSRGYHMVSGAVDFGLFRNAALEDVNKFKMLDNKNKDDDREDDKYWSE